MSDALEPGSRWRSAICATEVVAVEAPSGTSDVRCGGAAMVLVGTDLEPAPLDSAFAEGSIPAKRYSDEPTRADLLGVKSGDGSRSSTGGCCH